MRTSLITFVTFLLASGCASHEDPDGTSPKPPVERADSGETSKPKPKPVPVEVAVSSVYFSENCPEPKPAPSPAPAAKRAPPEKPSAGAPAEPMPRAEGDVSDEPAGDHDGRWVPGCSQSTMQLSLNSKAPGPLDIKIAEVRVRSTDGKHKLGSVQARIPMFWDAAAAFKPWDEKLPPGELKATYRLGADDWNKLVNEMDSGSKGSTFVLEVDVRIGDEVKTVLSPEFARAIPEEIVT